MLSIVIVVWNQWALTRACLESLAQQDMGERALEIVLVDNGSTDATVATVRSEYPTVRVLELGANTGFAVANNCGVAHATGKWILLLNNDTELEADALRHLLDAVQAHPEFRLAAPQMVQWRAPEWVDNRGIKLDWAGLFRQVDTGRSRHAGPRLAEVFGPSGGAALLHRDVVRAVGLFDPTLHSYQEDGDFACRARANGFRCLYVGDAVVRHHGSGTAATRGEWKFVQIHRNMARLTRRWFDVYPLSLTWWLERGYIGTHYVRALLSGRAWELLAARREGARASRTDARPAPEERERVRVWIGRSLMPLRESV